MTKNITENIFGFLHHFNRRRNKQAANESYARSLSDCSNQNYLIGKVNWTYTKPSFDLYCATEQNH